MTVSRRTFLGSTAAVIAAANEAARGSQQPVARAALAGEIGVTTGSFTRHLSVEPQPGKLRMLDLPKILRNELDLRVIDLMTATLPSLESSFLERLRRAADDAGCILTNLKINQPGLSLGSPDAELRRRSLAVYKQTIASAAVLGIRWVRPLPGPQRPDLTVLAASYRELIDFAAPRGISLLIENYGWLASDPDAIPAVLEQVGPGLAVQPDTGNWSDNTVRYAGLATAFPHAVSCDFKARKLGPAGEHAEYDLQKCFDIGWTAGFRGPWCFEYFQDDLPALYRDLSRMRDMLQVWRGERK